MLARPHRITSGDDYRRIVRRGVKCGGSRLVTSVVQTGDETPSRFGFILSKKVGNAVTRNRIRRRLKAISAGALPFVPTGLEVVFRVLPPAADASYTQLERDVLRCLHVSTEARHG